MNRLIEKWRLISIKTAKPRTFECTENLARVEEVIDGDTIKVITKHKNEPYYCYNLRLYGIDAPELHPKKSLPKCEEHKQAGIRAKEALTSILPKGKIILISFHSADKYGRLLGDVYLINMFCKPTKNVNQMMLDGGFAKAYDGGRKEPFQPDYDVEL